MCRRRSVFIFRAEPKKRHNYGVRLWCVPMPQYGIPAHGATGTTFPDRFYALAAAARDKISENGRTNRSSRFSICLKCRPTFPGRSVAQKGHSVSLPCATHCLFNTSKPECRCIFYTASLLLWSWDTLIVCDPFFPALLRISYVPMAQWTHC